MTYFYDTCYLLNFQDSIFKPSISSDQYFYISSITLQELENIKTSGHKDEEVKFKARKLIKRLAEYNNYYRVILYEAQWDALLSQHGLQENNDSRIIFTACQEAEITLDLVFKTSDICCATIAKYIGGLEVQYDIDDKSTDDYTGFVEVTLSTDEALADFYQDLQSQATKYNLIENQYLIVTDSQSNIIDKYKYTHGLLEAIPYITFDSKMFGKVKARDAYQSIAMDTLKNNTITLLGGPAGSGKSFLALSYLFMALERGQIDKIIIICNPIATRGAAKLGYYPGDKNTKLLDCQIGNFLMSKLGGDRQIIEDMIDRGQIILLPLSDARGYDTSGMNAGIYMTESQNTDVDLMKLILQRVGSDSKVIIEGDCGTQVDMSLYAGSNNGMRRASEVFRGHDCFGQVNLQTIYRSEIATIAEEM